MTTETLHSSPWAYKVRRSHILADTAVSLYAAAAAAVRSAVNARRARRRHLSDMRSLLQKDDHLLNDIGVTRAQVLEQLDRGLFLEQLKDRVRFYTP